MVLLHNTLRANSVFSVVAGLISIIFASPLSESMDVAQPVLYVVGAGVFLFGAAILFASRRSEVDLRFATTVALADIGWVLGAIAILIVPGSMQQKWVLVVISIPVAAFAVLQMRGIRLATQEKPLELARSIEIDAPPEAVWSELVDFGAYPDWNPFITEARGHAVEGTQLTAKIGGSSFKPVVTVAEDGASLEWLGSLLVPGVFDGRHRFQLTTVGLRTTVVQSEQFTGALAPMIWSMIDKKTEAGFDSMNIALKERVEGA